MLQLKHLDYPLARILWKYTMGIEIDYRFMQRWFYRFDKNFMTELFCKDDKNNPQFCSIYQQVKVFKVMDCSR